MAKKQALKTLTLANVALRSLLLEASWNHQGQQSLGLSAAVDPALKRIYGPGEELKVARRRYLEFFNTNPLTSGLLIGVMLNLEEDLARGQILPAKRQQVVTNLSQTLAAMGDALFWQAWLPLCCLVAVWAVLSLGSLFGTPLLLPILFCLPALPVRFGGLFWGYRQGKGIINLLYRLKVQRLAWGIRRVVALVLGTSTVILLSQNKIMVEGKSLPYLWLSLAGVLLCVMVLRTLVDKTQGTIIYWWYPVLVVTVVSIMVLVLG